MNLDDLIPAPDSKKIASVSQKVFGRSIKVESLTQEKAQSLRETFAARLNSLETKLGANVANNPAYLENKLFLETIDTYLGEGDGIYHDCATKFTHETYGECTVIPGEHTLLEDGTVTHYDATFVGEDGDQYIVRNVAVENMSNVISEGHKHKMEEDDDEMSDAARELELYAENDGQLYQQSGVPIMKNLSKKFKKGTYDSALAAKLWKYHADRAAKKYSQENSTGDDWKTMFTPRDRMEMARSMEDSWKSEMEAGNFMESDEATESGIVEGETEDAFDMIHQGIKDILQKTGGAGSKFQVNMMKDHPKLSVYIQDTLADLLRTMNSSLQNGKIVSESVIVEGEMEAAEQVMASKNMVDKIQGMVEDLGEMLNEDLPPLTDSIRDNMDSAMAEQFNVAMQQVLAGALEGMRQSREQVDAAARILTGEAGPEMMGDEAMADPEAEMEMEPTTDMEMDAEAPAEEDFAAADAAQAGEEELGRERRA